MGRKYFIDNLRIFCILLLFPFHNVMMYNDFVERWYVHIAECIQASFFNISVYAWWMPLLFLLAGMSAFYAFEKRTVKQYLMERVCKLYVPLAVSLLLVIPVQPYIADVFLMAIQEIIFSITGNSLNLLTGLVMTVILRLAIYGLFFIFLIFHLQLCL